VSWYGERCFKNSKFEIKKVIAVITGKTEKSNLKFMDDTYFAERCVNVFRAAFS